MTDSGARFIADGVSCFVESPHEIDVLTHGHGFIESTDGVECVDATHECSGRDVGDARPCSDPSAFGAAIE